MKPRLNQRIQFSLAYVLVAALVLLLLQSWLLAPRTVEIPMSKFLELLRAGKIEKVALTEREIRGIAKPGRPAQRAERGRRPAPPDARLRTAEVRVFTVTRIPGRRRARLVAELERTRSSSRAGSRRPSGTTSSSAGSSRSAS